MLDEQRHCLKMVGATPEAVLERGEVMNIHRDDAIGADRLEQLGDVARGHRIPQLGLAILASIAEVGDNGGDGSRRCVLAGADEEKQLDQLVVYARLIIAIERLN